MRAYPPTPLSEGARGEMGSVVWSPCLLLFRCMFWISPPASLHQLLRRAGASSGAVTMLGKGSGAISSRPFFCLPPVSEKTTLLGNLVNRIIHPCRQEAPRPALLQCRCARLARELLFAASWSHILHERAAAQEQSRGVQQGFSDHVRVFEL